MPHPPTSRAKIQEPFVRDQEIDPADYYPRNYEPDRLPDWPVEGDLVIPTEALPEELRQSMGEAHPKKAANLEVLREAPRD